jgi:hypothetical protein
MLVDVAMATARGPYVQVGSITHVAFVMFFFPFACVYGQRAMRASDAR